MVQRRKQKMKTPRIKRKLPPGTAPGELPIESVKHPVNLKLMIYNEQEVNEYQSTDFAALENHLNEPGTLWLTVEGTQDSRLIEQVGRHFKLHRLALEDVANCHQRSKFERYDNTNFIVMRMLSPHHSHQTEQVSIFLRQNMVIVFLEHSSEWFAPIRERIKHKMGRIRFVGAAYLAYALIDLVIDSYFPPMEKMADHLDELEERLLSQSTDATVAAIHHEKRELLFYRRIIWGHREMVQSLIREAAEPIDQDVIIYLRDCLDHTMQQLDLVDVYRDVSTDLMELAFSMADTKANEVMKFLTVVSAIFIPLTFITGLYGMNFNTTISALNMPELNFEYGYVVVLCVMLGLASGLIVWFKKKGWLSQ